MRNHFSFFIDIDGTITDYRPGALDHGKLLFGNFLFPIIRELMMEQGCTQAEAEILIRREMRENVFWCYGDFVRKFNLPVAAAAERFRAWHAENLTVRRDTVELIGMLAARHVPLYIISNNPVDGCLMKLERAGLPAGNFRGIFGTDVMRGCKDRTASWERALKLAGVAPETAAVIGDNEKEDGTVPRSCGIPRSFLLDRSSGIRLRRSGGFIRVNDARAIPEALRETAVRL